MKFTATIMAICAAANLCAATPINTTHTEPVESAIVHTNLRTTVEKTGNWSHINNYNETEHPVVDYTPLMMPILGAIAQTEVDFDMVFNLTFAHLENPPALDKRNYRHPPVCGMETVISEPCVRMHFCRYMCILGVKNFPYRSCMNWLINGRCPEGVSGVGHLRPYPVPPKQ